MCPKSLSSNLELCEKAYEFIGQKAWEPCMQLFLPGALVSPMCHVSLAWKCAMVTCVVFSEQKHATEKNK